MWLIELRLICYGFTLREDNNNFFDFKFSIYKEMVVCFIIWRKERRTSILKIKISTIPKGH
jgi:hypothetical protein